MIKSTLSWLGDAPRQRIGLRVLQVAIGCMLLFRCLTEFRFSSYLWGPHGLAYGSNEALFGRWMGAWMDAPFVSDIGVKLLILTLMGAALALVLGKFTRWATIVACVVFIMFENRLADVFDGGDNITRLVLCYLAFAMSAEEKWTPGSLRVWFHNLAIVAVVAQLMVLYLTSGFVKATGEPWNGGTALYLISQVETFSLPEMRPLLKNSVVVTMFAYVTVFFQIWFPVAVMSRAKFVWLVTGIGMHVGIATMMGLIPFSMVMIGLELFLITDVEYLRLRDHGRNLRRWSTDQLQQLRRRLQVPAPTMRVFLDGWCAHCQSVGRVLQRLDIQGRLAIVDFRRSDEHLALGITGPALGRRMHVAGGDGAVTSGFAAVQAVVRALPLLWPLRAPLWVLGVFGLGQMSYDFLAERRLIVPDGRACANDSACSLVPVEIEEKA